MIVDVQSDPTVIEGVDVVGIPVHSGTDGPRLAIEGARLEGTVAARPAHSMAIGANVTASPERWAR